MTWTLYQGDALEKMNQIESESISCCVTSPPYFGLRDYGVAGQLGLEATPEEYVEKMVEVFREVKRVLRKDGTFWVNLGDSYASDPGKGLLDTDDKNPKAGSRRARTSTLPPKNLVGIPWRVAFALQADGWYLRSDIIWAKPNPMPESVTDRPTKAHEYIFLLSKCERYFYDYEAIKEKVTESTIQRLSQDIDNQAGSQRVPGKTNGTMKAVGRIDKQRGHGRRHAGFNDRWDLMTTAEQHAMGRNKRTVWTVATQPFRETHFATFPQDLIKPCILAGCPIGGIVLDPFAGAGTTLFVSEQLERNSIGIELNPDYCNLIRRRMAGIEVSLFEEAADDTTD